MKPQVLVFGCVVLLSACDRGVSTTPRKGAGAAPQGTVALVNGAALSGEELEARLKADAHLPAITGEARARALDALIDEELAAQHALQKGYADDPGYKAEVEKLERQLAAYQRRELARLYFQRSQQQVAAPSEDALRRYFAEHEKELRTELRVFQILRRDSQGIAAAASALAAGKPFEEVATGGAAVPGGLTPWDLGYLNWAQLPEKWREVVSALPDGEFSAPIEGERGRYWIIKVVARRENPALKFEDVRDALANSLRAAERDAIRNRLQQDLREGAKIVILKDPLGSPAAEQEQE